MTLTEFLLARIAETEEDQREGMQRRYGSNDQWHALGCSLNNMNNDPCDCGIPARVLAECEAKRRIVQEYDWAYRQTSGEGLWIALRLLALPYADHPDHREEWKP